MSYKIDPRAGLFLLLIVNITIFKISSLIGIGILLVYISLLLFYLHYYRFPIKILILYMILVILLRYILPYTPKIIAMSFSIIVNYTLKMLPCFLIAYLMIKSMTMYELIIALRKMHCPEQLITSLSITLRYFPAIHEDIHYIQDAMRLKQISIIDKIKCLLIPLMISATNTVDELSQAAMTRGIDNPSKKTSMISLKFHTSDIFLCVFSCFIFMLVDFYF